MYGARWYLQRPDTVRVTVQNVPHTFRNTTFEATDTAHSRKYGGLHFDIPHAGLVCLPQVLQLVFVGEGTKSSVESALTYRETQDKMCHYTTDLRFSAHNGHGRPEHEALRLPS